jgi:uncharacterized cupin superfamily protein
LVTRLEAGEDAMAIMKWFTRNLADAQAMDHPAMGTAYLFGENRPRELFNDFGMNIRVLQPAQPASLYHSESAEETFLVLGGECLAIVEDEEVALKQWDFLHCPPDTAHVLVGAGDGPSTILMVGGRVSDGKVHYPVNEKAARFGASVKTESDNPQEAWAQAGLSFADFTPTRLPWPP